MKLTRSISRDDAVREARSQREPACLAATPDFQRMFAAATQLSIVVSGDAPLYTVVAESDAFARATGIPRQQMVGTALHRSLTPGMSDLEPDAAAALERSIERVFMTGIAETMSLRAFERSSTERVAARVWTAVNYPLCAQHGRVCHVVHRREEVADFTQLESSRERTLLIIDADEHERMQLMRVLEGRGRRLIAASRGREGLALFATERPDCVVLNASETADLSGLAVCRSIRAMGCGSDVFILIITAELDVTIFDQGLLAGADAMLTKPIQASELLARLQEALYTHCNLDDRWRAQCERLRRERERLSRRSSRPTVTGRGLGSY